MPQTDDLERLRQEYMHRERRLIGKGIYSPTNPANLFAIQQRERHMLRVLRQHGFENLYDIRILELGCGSGGILTQFLVDGADPVKMHGVDLLYPRLIKSHHLLPSSKMVNADGQQLPFSTYSFDLVLQFTAFSSVLDCQVKKNMAAEMLRVLNHQGLIIWYDFWLNPTNKHTLGIRPSEIVNLFPNCSLTFQKITLAPPLARKIVPLSWGLALFLESLNFLNSHYLVTIRKIK